MQHRYHIDTYRQLLYMDARQYTAADIGKYPDEAAEEETTHRMLRAIVDVDARPMLVVYGGRNTTLLVYMYTKSVEEILIRCMEKHAKIHHVSTSPEGQQVWEDVPL
jgi:hypothetical protein